MGEESHQPMVKNWKADLLEDKDLTLGFCGPHLTEDI